MPNKPIEPWKEYPHIWKTPAAWFSYLRGCLRKAWMRHPAKLEYIKKHRKRIANPNPRGKSPTAWGFTCEMCGKDFPQKDGQVDHKVEAGSLTKTEDIQGFVERLLYVSEDSLQYVCKECHAALTYASRKGISVEEAVVEKKVIALTKQMSVEDQKKLLDEHGLKNHNADVRRKGLKQLVEEGKL